MNIKKEGFNSELTIIVNTCDSYSDVLSLFFAAFSEYWTNCSFDIIINTEERLYGNYPAKVHNYKPTGCNSWGERFLQTLESVETEFVLVVYDDFILEDYVSEEQLISIVNLMKVDKNSTVFYLIDTNLPKSKKYIHNESFSEIIDYSDFKLNSAPAIWRKSDLIDYTGKYDNPWAWEVFGSYRTYGNRHFYTRSQGFGDLYKYNYSKGGAIYRGRWVREVVESKIKKYGLDIDLMDRGLSSDSIDEGRSLKWKIQFIMLGFKMVGFKAFYFIPRYLRAKLL